VSSLTAFPHPVSPHLPALADLNSRTRPEFLAALLPALEAEKRRLESGDLCRWDLQELEQLDLRIIRCKQLMREQA